MYLKWHLLWICSRHDLCMQQKGRGVEIQKWPKHIAHILIWRNFSTGTSTRLWKLWALSQGLVSLIGNPVLIEKLSISVTGILKRKGGEPLKTVQEEIQICTTTPPLLAKSPEWSLQGKMERILLDLQAFMKTCPNVLWLAARRNALFIKNSHFFPQACGTLHENKGGNKAMGTF